jgi:hypothetical protein
MRSHRRGNKSSKIRKAKPPAKSQPRQKATHTKGNTHEKQHTRNDLKDAIMMFMLLNHEQHGGCGNAPMIMYRLIHKDDPWNKESTSIVQNLKFRTRKDKTALWIWRAGLPDGKKERVDQINARVMINAMGREALYLLVDEHGYLQERRCKDNRRSCGSILSGLVEPDKFSNTRMGYRAAVLPPVPVALLKAHARDVHSRWTGEEA